MGLLDGIKTIAELGGANVPDEWNGQSLAGWMDNPQTKWRDLAVSEYYAHNIASGYAMLRTGSFKYVYHTSADDKHPAERELYDLAADPNEFTNLARQPDQKARIETLHAALVKELGRDPDETERRCRADFARGYGRGARGAGDGAEDT
jgi:arylsulfatase A-like enzyme